jgi:putative DNA primase/helicase
MPTYPRFRGRGLLARFLYFLPESRLGFRKLETKPVPDKIAQLWLHLVNSLLSIEPRLDNQDRVLPYIIKLSNEAGQEWGDFWNIVEVEMRPGGRFEQIPDWAGKLPGAAARIAGLFHCIENPDVPWEKK